MLHRALLITILVVAAVASRVEAQTSPPPAPPAPAVAPGVSPTQRELALKLARTVQPASVVVDESMKLLDRQIVAGLLANPNLAKLETQHPGVVHAMWEGAEPVIRQALSAKLPELWNVLADVYARRLSASQIQKTTTFFGSPVGQKFVLQMTRNMSLKPMLQDVMKDPNADISRGAYEKTVRGAAAAAATTLTPAEIAAMSGFFTSPEGLAARAISGEVSRAGIAWMNKSDPEDDAKIEEAMGAAAARFLAKKNR